MNINLKILGGEEVGKGGDYYIELDEGASAMNQSRIDRILLCE